MQNDFFRVCVVILKLRSFIEVLILAKQVVLNLSSGVDFMFCTIEDSSLLASGQESWMHGSQSFWVSLENLFNISIITLLSCWF